MEKLPPIEWLTPEGIESQRIYGMPVLEVKTLSAPVKPVTLTDYEPVLGGYPRQIIGESRASLRYIASQMAENRA